MKIFNMNDVDWYAGETGEECLKELQSVAEYTDEEIQELIGDGYPVEVPEDKMKKMKFYNEETDKTNTFQEELQRLIDLDETFPRFFASTEW